MDKRIKKLMHKAEELDWTYSPCNFARDGKGYEFEKYSSFGQDFLFSISATDKDGEYSADVMIRRLSDYIEDFNPYAEAMVWIGADGHGANGAPYDIEDIINDMIECKIMMQELLEEWEKL